MKYILILVLFSSTLLASTLDKVKKRGVLNCGVSTGLAGFSTPDSKGNWKGFDVDICRALAAVALGDKNKVKFVSLSAQQRFTALQSGEIDFLSRNTTKSLSRETSLGLNFGPIVYFDGQGFLVRKADGIKSAKDLNGASICTQQGTTTEINMADFFRKNRLKFKPVVYENNDEVVKSFFTKRCDAYTTDVSGLIAEKTKAKRPDDYIVLPEIISKEPLAPAVRHGDDHWYDLISFTIYALINAEELGIDSKNIDSFKKSKDPRIKKFLGITKGNGEALKIRESWVVDLIKQVGNYGEIFDRNLGKSSLLKLDRGLNNLWTSGGLMYSPPMR